LITAFVKDAKNASSFVPQRPSARLKTRLFLTMTSVSDVIAVWKFVHTEHYAPKNRWWGKLYAA